MGTDSEKDYTKRTNRIMMGNKKSQVEIEN